MKLLIKLFFPTSLSQTYVRNTFKYTFNNPGDVHFAPEDDLDLDVVSLIARKNVDTSSRAATRGC